MDGDLKRFKKVGFIEISSISSWDEPFSFDLGAVTFPTLHITNTRFLHGSSVRAAAGDRSLPEPKKPCLLPFVVWQWSIGATTFG